MIDVFVIYSITLKSLKGKIQMIKIKTNLVQCIVQSSCKRGEAGLLIVVIITVIQKLKLIILNKSYFKFILFHLSSFLTYLIHLMYNEQGYPQNNYQSIPQGNSSEYGPQFVPSSYTAHPMTIGSNPYNDPGNVNYLRQDSSCHYCQPICATIFLVAGLATGIILLLSKQISIGGAIAIIASAYILYLIIGCCCNSTKEYLQTVDKGENFHNYYNMLRGSNGSFEFRAVCYHYETRIHTRSDGRIETRQERVVTHTANEALNPTFTKDESGVMSKINAQTNMIFVEFVAKYKFLDPQSQMKFQNFYRNFQMRNTRDTHQDFSVVFKVDGMVEKRTYYVGELDHDYYKCFYGCGCLGCLLPFSCWMESKVTRFTTEVLKAVQI